PGRGPAGGGGPRGRRGPGGAGGRRGGAEGAGGGASRAGGPPQQCRRSGRGARSGSPPARQAGLENAPGSRSRRSARGGVQSQLRRAESRPLPRAAASAAGAAGGRSPTSRLVYVSRSRSRQSPTP